MGWVMQGSWALVGRREELDLVEAAFARPESRGVVLAGQPGVGKTRLARESMTLAAAAGLEVEWVVGTRSGSSIQFGAVAHLLPEDILTGDAGAPPARASVLRAATEALVSRAGDHGLVLVVDDAHLLDHPSAALVHHLAVTGTAFVVSTVRSGEPAPDAVVSLWKDGLAERVEIQPLSRPEVDRLVESALGAAVEGSTRFQLWETTRGNPLFLRELVLGGLDDGSLVETSGVWQWRGPFSPAPRLMDLLEERLGRLDDDQRSILEIVAEAEYVSGGVLDRLARWGAVEDLERRGLLESWLDGRRTQVRTAHPLYAEVVRARTPSTRARAIRSALADAVEEWGGRRREDLLRVARWRLAAGDPLPRGVAVQASRRAAQAFDYHLAESLARAGMRDTGSVQAVHALAEALVGQGRFAEVDDLLRNLEEEDQPEPVRAMSAVARATNLLWRMGKGEAAWDVLRRAEEAISEPGLRDELAATRATFLVFGGRTRDGIEVGLDVAERTGSERALVQTVPVVWGLNLAGRTQEAIGFIERVREPVQRLIDQFPLNPNWLDNNIFAARFFEGALEEAAQGMESRYQWTSERGSWERAVAAWAVAWIRRIQGQVRTAERRLGEAAALFRELDMMNHLPLCLSDLAQVQVLIGDLEGAEAALAEAERTRLAGLRHWVGHVGPARAWVAAAQGETSRAIEEALRTAEASGDMGQVVYQAAALHDAARLGVATEVADELETVAERADGWMIPAYAAHARALADTDPAALERVADSFEDMGAMLFAAEAAAAAARTYREQGLNGSGLAASARASRLADACEDARTPTLDTAEFALPLTRRQQEVASLAARGMSNHEIADRLVISLRTVENHLHSAYTELGIAGRQELAAIMIGPRQAAPRN